MLVASGVRSRRMKRRWKALEKLRFSGLAIFGIPPLLHFEKFYQHYMCRTGRGTFRAQKTSSACRSGPRSTESTNRVACLFHNFVRDLFGAQRVLHCFPRLAGSVWQHFMRARTFPPKLAPESRGAPIPRPGSERGHSGGVGKLSGSRTI